MLILRQSTAIDIRMGPFVDATDGVTPETGITLGAADQAEVLKENGAATVAMAGAFVAVTGCDGWYDYTASTTDTNTVGEVVFVVQDSSVCLPVYVRGFVVEEAVYDALYESAAAGPLQSTVAGRTLDVTATGAAGIDWGNVENPTTAVDLSGTDIQLCDTATTLTNLPAITTNWLTAAGIAASALDGKGDWNIGKTGYSLTQTFPTNFSDMSITATTGRVDVASVAGTAQTAGDISALVTTVDTVVDGIQADLDNGTDGLGAIKATADAVETDTQNIQSRLPTALIGGRMDSDVEAINNSTTAAIQLALSAAQIENGACEGTPSTTVIQTDLAETQDDIYIGRTVIFTSGNARGEATDIIDYAGATGTITVTALANAPSSSDTFILI